MGCLLANYDLHTLLDNACLVYCDLFDGGAQRIDMIETDRGDGANERLHDIGGIYRSAQAHFNHSKLAVSLLIV